MHQILRLQQLRLILADIQQQIPPVSNVLLGGITNRPSGNRLHPVAVKHELHRTMNVARVGFLPDRVVDDSNLVGSRKCAANRSEPDRKSTRLNSSHLVISYAVFCLKKK